MQRKKPLEVDYCERLGQQEETVARELRERFPAWGRLPQQVCRQPYLAVADAACHPGILAEREVAECRDFARLFGRYPDQVIEALRFARERLREWEREREAQKQRDAETQAGQVRSFLLHTPFVVKKAGKFIGVEALTPADFQQDRQTLCKGVKLVPVAELQDGEVAQFLSSRKLPVPDLMNGEIEESVPDLTDSEMAQFVRSYECTGSKLTDDAIAHFLRSRKPALTEREKRERPRAVRHKVILRKVPVETQSVKRARQSLSPKQPIPDKLAAAKQAKANAILDKLSARKGKSAGRKRAAKGKE